MVISRFVIGALGTMVIEKQAIVIKSDLEWHNNNMSANYTFLGLIKV